MKKSLFETILKVLMLSVIVCAVNMSGTSSAATIIVKPDGTGNYRTIGTAISHSIAGDKIEVYPGIYSESLTIDRNVTIVGHGPHNVQIASTDDVITINGNITTTITGLKIIGGQYGIIIKSSNSKVNIEVKNCIITSCTLDGIKGENGNDKVTFNVKNCTISNNTGSGLSMWDEHTYIESSIIASNYGYGIDGSFDWGGVNFSSRYNNVWSNTKGNYNHRALAGPGDISQNPLFIDPSASNFVLRDSSPCKNAGRMGADTTDPDGTTNDMGAYGGPGAALFWPYAPGLPVLTDLSVSPSSASQGSTVTITGTAEVR